MMSLIVILQLSVCISAAPSAVVLKIVSNLVTATVHTSDKVDDIVLTVK